MIAQLGRRQRSKQEERRNGGRAEKTVRRRRVAVEPAACSSVRFSRSPFLLFSRCLRDLGASKQPSLPAAANHVEPQPARSFTTTGGLAPSNPQQRAATGVARVVEGARQLDAVARHLFL